MVDQGTEPINFGNLNQMREELKHIENFNKAESPSKRESATFVRKSIVKAKPDTLRVNNQPQPVIKQKRSIQIQTSPMKERRKSTKTTPAQTPNKPQTPAKIHTPVRTPDKGSETPIKTKESYAQPMQVMF